MMAGNSVPLHCEVCNKRFSGYTPAQQHYTSSQHLKKVQNAQLYGQQDHAYTYCEVCNKNCDTVQMLEIHKQSKRHLAEVEKQRELSSSFVPNSQAAGGTPARPVTDANPDQKEYVFNGSRGVCYVCNIELTSDSHATSHINGKNHTKKKIQWEASRVRVDPVGGRTIYGRSTASTEYGMQKAHNNGRVSDADVSVIYTRPEVPGISGLYTCAICNITCSGPENEEQHKLGEKHRKNVKLMELEKKGKLLPLSCNACGCSFTGQENAEQHFSSDKHKQKQANVRFLVQMSAKENSNKNEGNVADMTRNVNATHDIKSASQKDSDDDILLIKPFPPDTSDVLKPVSPSTVMPKTPDSPTNNLPVLIVQNNLGCPTIGRGRGLVAISNTGDGPLAKLLNKRSDTEGPGFRNMMFTNNGLRNKNVKVADVASSEEEKANASLANMHETGMLRGGSRYEQLSDTVYKQIPDSKDEVDYTDCGLDADTLKVMNEQEQFTKTRNLSGTSGTMSEFVFDETIGKGHCFACTIDLTSKEHKVQHVEGKNHARASKIWATLQSQNAATVGSLVCKICHVTFPGPEAQQQHLASARHKTKEKQYTSGVQEYFCEICKVPCTGEANFEQHLAGAQHRKNAGNTAANVPFQSAVGHDYFCEVCKVPCTGEVNFQQHLAGAQHRKMAGFKSDDVLYPSAVGQEYFCEVCKVSCSGEVNYEQHLAGAQHRKNSSFLTDSVSSSSTDRTIWFDCETCRCRLNSSEQLRIHNRSPKHQENERKNQLLMNQHPTAAMYQNAPSLATPGNSSAASITSQVNTGLNRHMLPNNSTVSPLEAFLSEELFPAEFLPENIDKAKVASGGLESNPRAKQVDQRPFESVAISNEPIPTINQYAMADVPDSSSGAMHGSGAKRGQTSDLAWATRNRTHGTGRTSPCMREQTSNASTPIENPSGHDQNIKLGIGRSQIDNARSVFNPYAATHAYYCSTCKAPMNTQESYESHMAGKRHLQKVCTEKAPLRQHLEAMPLGEDYVPQTKTKPRNYQMELHQKAMKNDTLCFLPTGTGKTLVSVLTLSAMLDKYPSKNILFLVDKVLLVIQQAKYIRKELEDKTFYRVNPEVPPYTDVEERPARVTAVCMGQQNTDGIPLWKHDVVVVTAAFCQNLLDKEILRWTDFSLVVFDEAHHCEKRHPFNVLLERFHLTVPDPSDRPKVLGLTASPAGKSDVPQTVQMLKDLIGNMGNVSMSIVDETQDSVETLKQFQSNAEMIIKCQGEEHDTYTDALKSELYTYIAQCYMKLAGMSNIKDYVDISFKGTEVRTSAVEAIEENFDILQSSIEMAQSTSVVPKVDFMLFTKHVQCICMVLSSLIEGGPLCALEEVQDMETTDSNFALADKLGVQVEDLRNLLINQSEEVLNERGRTSENSHESRLISELTKSRGAEDKSISLVLVKERGTAHRLTKLLQNSPEMKRAGLNTTTVVGHGGGGSGEKGMTVGQQKRTLEEIKQNKYQVIIATSVAEEGVDWPECELVISLYPPSTVTALVQMRGRARKKNSKFIVLCSGQEEQEKLDEIRKRENNMIIATKALISQSYNNPGYND